jgi:hypothetical protein
MESTNELIYVVDDDRRVRTALSGLLSANGRNVQVFRSGGNFLDSERWPHSFGQTSEIFKWNVRGGHAADLIAGSVAKYASSGVRSSRLE